MESRDQITTFIRDCSSIGQRVSLQEQFEKIAILFDTIDELRTGLNRYKKVVDEACGLLTIARCPNLNCQDGVLQVGINGDDIEQCQWCYMRDEAVRKLEGVEL